MNEARSDARTAILIALGAFIIGGLGIYHVTELKGKVISAELTAKSATEQALAAAERVDDLVDEMNVLRLENAQLALAVEEGRTANLGATNAIPTVKAFFETSLAANISSSATSFTLTSATDKEGNTLASSTYPFVIDEGTANEEMVLADCTGTTCTNVTRGVSVLSGTTSVATLMKSHRRGASVKITDGPSLLILSRLAAGTGNYPNVLKYESNTPDCAAAQEICDYDYVTNLAFNGAGVINATAAAKGVIELAASCEAASSTSSGGSGASLGIPTTLATSTWNSVTLAGCKVVVANNLGKIDSNFLATSTMFSTGLNAGTTTISGSLTLSGGSATSNIASSSIVAFTSSTSPSTTWTKPANLKYVLVEVIGGGGNGGDAAGGGGGANSASGGGGGGYCAKIIPASALGSTETVFVGGGGSWPSESGGTSSFGSHCSATGGGGGNASNVPGAGGTASGGDKNVTGQGGDASTGTGGGGVGGSSGAGMGGGGRAGFQDNGANGGQYGGGGGGAQTTSGGSGTNGGTGATGAVFVQQFFF